MENSGDFETRSTVDLRKSGVYKYAECPHTDVWCFAFAAENENDIQLWTPFDAVLGGEVDELLRRRAADKSIPWRAWNAQFERIIWREIMVKRYGFAPIEVDRWTCTAAEAAAVALPRALENAARVLGADEQKDDQGAALMKRMAKPRNAKELKINPDAPPIWWDDPERRQRLYDYCKQDVRTERSAAAKIRRLSQAERRIYLIDQRINDRGIMLDTRLAASMQTLADEATRRANAELSDMTNGRVLAVTKPRDIAAYLNELNFSSDVVTSVDKEAVQRLLATDLPEAARQVLNLRVEAGKSSISKLVAMFNVACADERMRGLLLYHGAGPGRWAGRLVQPQNFYARSAILPEGFKPERWIEAVLDGRYDLIDLCHPVLEVLAMLLRACLIPGPGRRFIGGDFNAIEARVLAWLAGATKILDGFANGTDPYKIVAASIYRVLVSEVTKPQRQMGKRAILGCGFGMGAEKFVAACYKESGQIIELPFAQRVVSTYRDENKEIPALWRELERCAVAAVKTPGEKFYAAGGKLIFTKRGDFLWIVLPNRKRALAYYKPWIVTKMTPWGREQECVAFWGENSKRQWVRQDLYGGLIAENVTQATARDLMAEAMLRAEDANYPIVLTVHDELLAEPELEFGSAKEFDAIMCDSEPWAAGCPVAAEVEVMPRYKK